MWGGVSLVTLDRPLSEKDKAGGRTVIDVDEEEELLVVEEVPEESVLVVEEVPEESAASEAESTHLDQGHDEKEEKEPEEISRRAGQPVENLDEVGGAWHLLNEVPHDFQPFSIAFEPSVSMVATGGEDGPDLGDVPTPEAAMDRQAWHEFNDVNEFDEVIEAYIYGQDGEDPNDSRLDMTFGLDNPKNYGPKIFLPDGRDYFRLGEGHLVVYHVEPRKHYFVPYPVFGNDQGFGPVDLRSERLSVCKYHGRGPFRLLTVGHYHDDWRENGERDPDLGYWVGYSVFTFEGWNLPWYDAFYGDGDLGGEEDDPDENDEDWNEDEEEESGESETSSTSYGTLTPRSRSLRRAGGCNSSSAVGQKARDHVKVIQSLGKGTAKDWAEVLQCGDELLTLAGGVKEAAEALWHVRKEQDLDNLRGVQDKVLDGLIHPLLLDYLRSVEEKGMVARHPGSTERVEAGLHPNAKAHLDQVYKQIFKDVRKHRALVVRKDNVALGNTVSSPFEAVDKMLPDRSIAPDKRVVHDQRQVNQATSKWWHPPALQPTHQQIARRVLWHKTRFPGIDVVICKRDIAGAFRLLWLAPKDAHLFAGDLPWKEEMMEQDTEGIYAEGNHEKSEMTVIYLVSSFGFSGAPGEWTAFGRATEEYHRAHRPGESRRDGLAGFDAKILVDDMVLVEPLIGLRPWTSASCYDEGVRLMLGKDAVNEEKNLLEGAYKEEQTIWGLNINTKEDRASLPSRRIEKGAHLLAHPAFDFDSKVLTLRQLQQFRGIATGWAVVVRGLKNELKAADVFLTCGDGSMPVTPRVLNYTNEKAAGDRAWDDLWALFEVCRWLCARPEMWEAQFGATLDELLEPRERLCLPGGHRHAVFVSADATPSMVGALDWTNKLAAQMSTSEMGPWLREALKGEQDEDKVRIHVSEMLAFTALAATCGVKWAGKVVIYAGDNTVVRSWITKRQSGSRAGRLLLRVLAMCEMRYGFTVVAGWWRTFHNVDSDFVTRCTREEFEKFIETKGWSEVRMQEPVELALKDTEKFGPCFLSWADPEDRRLIMQLKEQRVKRAIDKPIGWKWSDIEVVEWTTHGRKVKDFEVVARACGAAGSGQGKCKIVMGTIGCDLKGTSLESFLKYTKELKGLVGVVEGPCLANWSCAQTWCEKAGWACIMVEYLTTEFGEALARRRKALMAVAKVLEDKLTEEPLVRTVVATPLGTLIKPGEVWKGLAWEKPARFSLTQGVPRDPLLPHVAAHLFWVEEGDRVNIHGLSGPGKWPLVDKNTGKYEQLYVYDRAAPEGHVRPLSFEEVWKAQGRSPHEWIEAVENAGGEEAAYAEGCRATGVRTAESLPAWAATVAHGRGAQVAGAIRDRPQDESLARLLIWLRLWKRGEFGQESDSWKAGGCRRATVSRLGEALWLEVLEDEENFVENHDRKAGGRRGRAALKQEAESKLGVGDQGQGFDGDVHGKVEDWLEANLCGDKADSTAKAYAGAWSKWCIWTERQQWPSHYLNPKEDKLENENKILAFLGYLGWLNFSSASLKQAVFAIKDAHKRAGAGDPTEGQFRLWVLMNGLDRRAARKPRRLGVTPAMLQWVGRQFAGSMNLRGEGRVDGVMVQAALLTAWFFMMRASEFCDSNGVNVDHVLRGLDVKLSKEDEPVEVGLATEVTVQFRKTKADQEAFGSCKTMARTGVAHLCPVEALDAYRKVCPGRFQGAEAHKPLFRWGNGTMLKRVEVQFLLQRAATAVGLPPERFLSHSLRIGGASALFQASADIELVKRMGRWTSSSVQRYLYDGGQALKELAGKMAQVDKKIHYT